jgi:(p)ppGpp synthase/HD superfamily hydrolase
VNSAGASRPETEVRLSVAQPASPLSERFDAALVLAHRIHRRQRRKGTEIPYIAHVLTVSALVLEHGGNEVQAIAALLHDAIEDAPPELGVHEVRRQIREQFGDAVLAIVEHCSDTDVQPKPPWIERKASYLEHLAVAADEALLVSAADKLHNLRSLLRDHRVVGEALWDRFNKDAGRKGTLGYHRALVETFKARLQNPIVNELDDVLQALEAEAGGRCSWPPAAMR